MQVWGKWVTEICNLITKMCIWMAMTETVLHMYNATLVCLTHIGQFNLEWAFSNLGHVPLE